ncbi:hypothetical protein V5739_13840 [Salinimicrobium sp. TIG7-5_MAKvit]|uniref:beta-barrel fold lipoprotein n=1 Tax=Salinimicrobium sp. TIG7-5_MAKvit TaxID=3121289 RepID=UPI003C6DEC6D
MKKIIYLLPLLLLCLSCSNDSSDDLPGNETGNSTFTVEYSQTGDSDQFSQEITFYSAYGWKDTDSEDDVNANLNSENSALPQTLSYTTKQASPGIWVTYNVAPHNSEVGISLEVTFKFYKDGELIDTKNLSIGDESTAIDSFQWEYFSDTSEE